MSVVGLVPFTMAGQHASRRLIRNVSRRHTMSGSVTGGDAATAATNSRPVEPALTMDSARLLVPGLFSFPVLEPDDKVSESY